jgi:hypothetical protein
MKRRVPGAEGMVAQRQHHGTWAARAHDGLHLDAVAVGLRDPAGDGQPQSGAGQEVPPRSEHVGQDTGRGTLIADACVHAPLVLPLVAGFWNVDLVRGSDL